jgi:hypothetical protein
MPFPFQHANGRICCSTREACCPNCEAKIAAEARANVTPRAASLRTAIDSTPPDPYAAGLEKMRGEHLDLTPDLDPRHAANPMTPPDSYAIHLNYARAVAGDTPPGKTPLDAGGVPDPYAAGLAKMRNNR